MQICRLMSRSEKLRILAMACKVWCLTSLPRQVSRHLYFGDICYEITFISFWQKLRLSLTLVFHLWFITILEKSASELVQMFKLELYLKVHFRMCLNHCKICSSIHIYYNIAYMIYIILFAYESAALTCVGVSFA